MTSHRILQLNAVSTAVCAIGMLAPAERCFRSSASTGRSCSMCLRLAFWLTLRRWRSPPTVGRSAARLLCSTQLPTPSGWSRVRSCCCSSGVSCRLWRGYSSSRWLWSSKASRRCNSAPPGGSPALRRSSPDLHARFSTTLSARVMRMVTTIGSARNVRKGCLRRELCTSAMERRRSMEALRRRRK
jgi:hypothetical protein